MTIHNFLEHYAKVTGCVLFEIRAIHYIYTCNQYLTSNFYGGSFLPHKKKKSYIYFK